MTDTPTEQPRRRSRCPKCGAEATAASLAHHSLSAVGYLHDDQAFECSECGHSYAHGVPVGEFDGDADDLWCAVCNLGFMRVHRVEKQADGVRLHLKCPHHHPFDCPECDREIDADGVELGRTGQHACPHCAAALDRAAVPYCFYFQFAHRVGDARKTLVGYPDITGNLGAAESAYGYAVDSDGNPVRRPEDRDRPPACDEPACIIHGDGTLGCPNAEGE